jgi:hypothetical protein
MVKSLKQKLLLTTSLASIFIGVNSAWAMVNGLNYVIDANGTVTSSSNGQAYDNISYRGSPSVNVDVNSYSSLLGTIGTINLATFAPTGFLLFNNDITIGDIIRDAGNTTGKLQLKFIGSNNSIVLQLNGSNYSALGNVNASNNVTDFELYGTATNLNNIIWDFNNTGYADIYPDTMAIVILLLSIILNMLLYILIQLAIVILLLSIILDMLGLILTNLVKIIK